jgi:hypothetical protein
LASLNEGNELVQKEKLVAKRRESLEVYLYGALKKLAIGLGFKIWTKSGGRGGHCPAGTDKVQLEDSVALF